ncbi:MAG: ATP-binding protein [Deltaproteobacteria bacterium]|nr:ATP-binding protein [Deltaproteobacteria bacterium]
MLFRRSYWIERIEEAWKRRPLVWLAGVRRVGKTVLCQSLRDVEYFDCELPRVRRGMADPEAFLRGLKGKRIVLDEVHRLDAPSEVLKIAADHFPDVRVLATGSSTLQASAKFKDALTGRKVEVWLTPMMSADLHDFGGLDLVTRLGRGGLPPFTLAADPREADFQEWMDSYWAKDIQELFRLERRASFVRFVELLLSTSGGIFEATKYATPCEVSRTTIANYLGVLEATRVAHVVRPFSTHRRTEIVAAPKVYAFDTGFVTYYRGWRDLRREDLGHLWEYYVLNELQSRLPEAPVRYWRDTRGHEVDFIVTRRGRMPTAVECKWSASGSLDLSGLAAFRRAYPQGRNLVVAADVDRPFDRREAALRVEHVGLEDLIARLRHA